MENFPSAIACVLMPNHLHLLASGPPTELRLRLSNSLAWLSRRFFPRTRVWESVPEPSFIPDSKHLLRNIRYVHLNPCRAKLIKDPLEWEWSTHRDWTGLVADSWPDLEKISRVLGGQKKDVAERFHQYISSDPTVQVSGSSLTARTPLDIPARKNSVRLVSRAVECAFRRPQPHTASEVSDLRTRTLQFLFRHSELTNSQIAREIGISRQAVWKKRYDHELQKPGTSELESDKILLRVLCDDRIMTIRSLAHENKETRRPRGAPDAKKL